MKILAIDSSSLTASIAFVEYSTIKKENILFDFNRPQERTNSSVFFEGIQQALQKCGKPDRLVVGLGPGSYNGLRSSIAAAQGIAASSNIELVGLPSILGIEISTQGAWIIGDARGGQYWLAALSSEQKLLQEPFLLTPTDLPNHLKNYPDFSLISSQQISHLPDGLKLKMTIKNPDAKLLARLAKDATPIDVLEPLYLKPPHIT